MLCPELIARHFAFRNDRQAGAVISAHGVTSHLAALGANVDAQTAANPASPRFVNRGRNFNRHWNVLVTFALAPLPLLPPAGKSRYVQALSHSVT